jgi:hypothetical protein
LKIVSGGRVRVDAQFVPGMRIQDERRGLRERPNVEVSPTLLHRYT